MSKYLLCPFCKGELHEYSRISGIVRLCCWKCRSQVSIHVSWDIVRPYTAYELVQDATADIVDQLLPSGKDESCPD